MKLRGGVTFVNTSVFENPTLKFMGLVYHMVNHQRKVLFLNSSNIAA